jgi:hypothetical protein
VGERRHFPPGVRLGAFSEAVVDRWLAELDAVSAAIR